MSKKTSKKNDNVFYLNMDLYPSSQGADVSFYQELYKYKSVEDYLKKKKNKKRKKRKTRKNAFLILSQDTMTSIPYNTDLSGSNQFGMTGHVTPSESFFGETIGTLGYGVSKDKTLEEDVDDELDEAISSPLTSLYGDQNSVNPIEDEFSIYETLNDLGRRDPVFTGILDGAPNPIQKY